MRKCLGAFLLGPVTIPVAALTMALVAALGSASAGAQAAESARQRQLTVTAGAIATGFETRYDTNYPLFGAGAYVDVHFTHWIQLEAEGRWLRFNDYYGETQSNYLIGPRVPIKQFGKFQSYGKVLVGLSKMQFPRGDYYDNGSFTTLAFGGTLDYRLNKRWSLRAIDFEYQDWPHFIPKEPGVVGSPTNSLQPYGVSVGVGYRVF